MVPKNEQMNNRDYSVLDSQPGKPTPKLGRGEKVGFYSQEKIAELKKQAHLKDKIN